MQSAESILSLKREKFRTVIRKQEIEKLFKKKRINLPKLDLQNVELDRIRLQIYSIQENVENDFPKAMNKYYDHLVDKDMMNVILNQFEKNHEINSRTTIYWILSNLTLGDGIGSKFLFDTTFDFLNIVFLDLRNIEYSEYVLEIIQNLLADRDIDVFEYLMKDDQLLKQLNRNIESIAFETYEHLLVHICARIVQFRSELSNYLVDTLCQLLPKYVAFQCTFILTKDLEIPNYQLVLYSMEYLDKNDDTNQNFILLKILEQVQDSELLMMIVQKNNIIDTLNFQLFNSKNPNIKNTIIYIYHNIVQIEEIQHYVCDQQTLKYIIYLSRQQEYSLQSLKFLNNLTNDLEFLLENQEIIEEDYFLHHLQNLDPDEPALAIQTLKFIKHILVYGDDTNDDIYLKLFTQNKQKIEYLFNSKNDILSYAAKVLLQCYD